MQSVKFQSSFAVLSEPERFISLWEDDMTESVFRFATVHGRSIQWFLRRNCSISPQQLFLIYGMLCTVSLAIASFFWMQGATLVLPFALLEVSVLGYAFWVYAKHATDRERILLQDSQLVVELESGGKVQRAQFQRDWVRVEPQRDDQSLIEVYGQGRSISVGRYIRPELRPLLAREIRQALRGT
jgi:uncharacterized membrane protein